MGILDERAIAEVEPTPKIRILEDAPQNSGSRHAWIVGYSEAELPAATGTKLSQLTVCSSRTRNDWRGPFSMVIRQFSFARSA